MPQPFEGAIKNWQFSLKFIAFSIVFFLLEFAYQFYFNPTGDLYSPLVRAAGLAGATFTAAALLCSPIFRWTPALAKYWTVRRALGVAGFVFILMHILAAMQFYFNWDIAKVYFSLNPFVNPIVFGTLAFIILLPVTLTSTDWAMQKLGGKWKMAQRLVYFGFWAMVFHFLTVNPPQINNPAGYLVLAIIGLALLGELYWFLKTAKDRKFQGVGVVVGLIVILLYLLGIYFAWVAK